MVSVSYKTIIRHTSAMLDTLLGCKEARASSVSSPAASKYLRRLLGFPAAVEFTFLRYFYKNWRIAGAWF